MIRSAAIEKMLWSIALPGFGQLLNGKYVKGLTMLALEFIINQKSHLNQIIVASFQGDIPTAIRLTDYQWLMFYPCVYMFAIYDAYRDTFSADIPPYSVFPFAFAAFFATIGVIYSPIFWIFGVLLGPVWLPMLCCFLGILVGSILQFIFRKLTQGIHKQET
ncbi:MULTISPECIES: hypothetical protein [Brevibacillus]|uniref:Uncharacterized protein n=1 Tax=Brevibacillus brevis (strain 47 / JCM 6285 / NBRC 100599) TaxID=358681 RepID=C0Z6J9_BREBN|nr:MULTISPECIES: hypothetical protein [Brevibacillus]BAH46198.1 hypothetical protein BBR47_52210 [Brevibacillus brevis NBRC 100599]